MREIVGESLRRSRSSAPTCRVQASVPWSRGTRRRQPALRPEQSRGPFPSRPEPGRQRPGALHSPYRLHGCPLHCPLKCPRGAARGAPPIWLGGAANLLVRKPASEEASAIKSACTLRDDVVECTRRALTDCSCMAGAAMCEFGNRVSTSLGRRGRLVLRLK